MTTECPNCKKPLKGKEDEPFICYSCGTITTKDKIVQIGIGKYKFTNDTKDYVIVFESYLDKNEFEHQVVHNKEDYKYAKIETPRGVEILV